MANAAVICDVNKRACEPGPDDWVADSLVLCSVLLLLLLLLAAGALVLERRQIELCRHLIKHQQVCISAVALVGNMLWWNIPAYYEK